MTPDEKVTLDAAGWRVATVKEFLGLTDDEMAEVERRVAAEMAARRRPKLSKRGAKIVEALTEMVEGLKVRNAKEGDTP